jgi:hypothetical protein
MPAPPLSSCINAAANLPKTSHKHSPTLEESPHLNKAGKCQAYNQNSSVTPMDVGSGPQTENVQQKQSVSKNCVMVTRDKSECKNRECQKSPELQTHSKKVRKKNGINGVVTAVSCESSKMDTCTANMSACQNGGESRVENALGMNPAVMNLQETWSQEASLKKKKGKCKSVNDKLSSMSEALESTFTGYLKEMISNNMHAMENISPNHHHNTSGDRTNETVILHRPQLHDPKSTKVIEDLCNAKNHYEVNHRQHTNHQHNSINELGQTCTKRKSKKDSSANGSPTHPVNQKAARNEPEQNTNRKSNRPSNQAVRSALTNQTNHTLSPHADSKMVSPPRDSPKSPAGKGKPEQVGTTPRSFLPDALQVVVLLPGFQKGREQFWERKKGNLRRKRKNLKKGQNFTTFMVNKMFSHKF